jgi:hypothetical protein
MKNENRKSQKERKVVSQGEILHKLRTKLRYAKLRSIVGIIETPQPPFSQTHICGLYFYPFINGANLWSYFVGINSVIS